MTSPTFTFADLDKLEVGAKFYTADLHVHSFGSSADVKDPALTIEAIIDAAAAAGLGLVSITDHNNDKSVLSSVAYGVKYADKLLVLPGVESRSRDLRRCAFSAALLARALRRVAPEEVSLFDEGRT